jgi:transposase
MVHMPTFEEIAALRQALSDAIARGEELVGELRVVRTERDLLKEQLNRFKRQLFEPPRILRRLLRLRMEPT